MTRRTKRRRTAPPWPLARVVRDCRSAPAVWLALLDLGEERGSRLVTPTRDMLVKRTGIVRLPTISQALTLLDRAGWIEVEHIPKQDARGRRSATLLRVRLLRMERKTLATEQSAVSNEKRSISKERKTFRSPLRGRRDQHAASPVGTATADAAVESDATRIERERLEAIRAKRSQRNTKQLDAISDV